MFHEKLLCLKFHTRFKTIHHPTALKSTNFLTVFIIIMQT